MIASNLQLRADRITYPKRMVISAIPAAQLLLRDTMRGVAMKRIPLTQDKFALVDDSDFEWLNQWKWCAARDKKTYYAIRKIPTNSHPRQIIIRMHRQILNAPKEMLVDHRNSNGLDNQRENIRLCTFSQNSQNRCLSRSTSGFKGVYWNKRKQKWHSRIRVESKYQNLGYHFCIVKAAKAYDEAAIKHFRDFANINFKEMCKNGHSQYQRIC